MPSKAQRSASRQARLSRRKKRDRSAPQKLQSRRPQQVAVNEAAVEAQPTRSGWQASSVSTSTPTETRSSVNLPTRSRRRVSDTGASNVSKYLGRELIQIGAITSLIAVIFVGLTFVLS